MRVAGNSGARDNDDVILDGVHAVAPVPERILVYINIKGFAPGNFPQSELAGLFR